MTVRSHVVGLADRKLACRVMQRKTFGKASIRHFEGKSTLGGDNPGSEILGGGTWWVGCGLHLRHKLFQTLEGGRAGGGGWDGGSAIPIGSSPTGGQKGKRLGGGGYFDDLPLFFP